MSGQKGRKFDSGKPQWSLLPWQQVDTIVRVLGHGAKKYGKDNWQHVKPKERYFDAMIRHLVAYKHGEKTDFESGFSHLAHAGCCLLFLMWHDDIKQ